jgi:uncharacterized membrane protein YfcA
MPLTDPFVWLLALVTFFSSIVSATFGLGGGLIILAVLGIVLPVSAMVPLHSILALGLLTSRFWYFREHVDWSITRSFIPGAFIGVVCGAATYVTLPEAFIAATVSILILTAIWFPRVNWRPSFAHPFFYVGIAHAFLSTLFSFGALMQPLMIRTRLNRMQIIGTLAAALTVMTCMKTVGYAAFGFDYRPYTWLIVAGMLASVPGAAAGKYLARWFREEQFRTAFRIVMTLLALRLLYKAWTLI